MYFFIPLENIFLLCILWLDPWSMKCGILDFSWDKGYARMSGFRRWIDWWLIPPPFALLPRSASEYKGIVPRKEEEFSPEFLALRLKMSSLYRGKVKKTSILGTPLDTTVEERGHISDVNGRSCGVSTSPWSYSRFGSRTVFMRWGVVNLRALRLSPVERNIPDSFMYPKISASECGPTRWNWSTLAPIIGVKIEFSFGPFMSARLSET